MATLAVTNTFVSLASITAAGHNTNFSDIVTYVNNRNDGSATWDVVKVTSASTVPFIANNSTGTSNIANFQDNGTSVLSVADGGATTITATAGGSSIPLTVNNNTSTGSILILQDNGGTVFSVADGGDVDIEASVVINDNGAVRNVRIESDNDANLFVTDGTNDKVGIGTNSPSQKLHVSGTSNGSTPRIVCTNINSTAGQSRTSLITAQGDNTNVEVSIQAGKDASNNNVELVSGTTKLDLGYGGTAKVEITATQADLVPLTDGSQKCGKSGSKWSEIWATNGTVQTSHTSTKAAIEDVLIADVVIPDAIKFNRPGQTDDQKQFGFKADDLPEECFALKEDGTRSTTDVYTSSVLGMLCAAIQDIQGRLTAKGL
jgi:hypothetical protein